MLRLALNTNIFGKRPISLFVPEQADGYGALFRALEGEGYVMGLLTCGYWWDDVMDPFDTKMSPSVGQSVRGKLAEAVLSKWCA